MGAGRRLIQRRHKLRDDVTDNVPDREKIEKRDVVLQDSPGAYGLTRKYRRRQDRNFGKDSLDRKIELAWEVAATSIDRFDYGGGDFGLRITLPSSSEILARGFKDGDELRILCQTSLLSKERYVAVEEANSGDVAAGFVRIVSGTEWRLPDGIVTPAVAASGRIDLDLDMTDTDLVDGETITLDDGVNPATVLEFDLAGGGVTPGNVAVVYNVADSAQDIRDALVAAINGVGAGLAITASPGSGAKERVHLVNDATGVAGNVAIVETVASAKLAVTGMAGGVDGATAFVTENNVRIRAEIGAGVRK
jgi:hypothetical protein